MTSTGLPSAAGSAPASSAGQGCAPPGSEAPAELLCPRTSTRSVSLTLASVPLPAPNAKSPKPRHL